MQKNWLYYVIVFLVVLILFKSRGGTNKAMEYKYSMNNLLNKIPASDRTIFKAVLLEGCKKLRCKPIDLLSVMYSESGLNPAIVNPDGGATGMLQFMPNTAKNLGTSTDSLKKMKASKQLIYVFKYLKPYSGKLTSPFAIYLVTFFPAGLNHINQNSWVFEAKKLSRSKIAKSNKTMDLNKDSKITMGEFKKWFKTRIYKSK